MRFLLIAALFSVAPLAAQPADTLAALDFPSRLVAGVSPAPPFAIKNPDGTWDGIAVELWRRIGRQAGFEAELREVPMEDLLDAVAGGTVDVALTLRASPEGETRVDFTASHYTASLGVAETKGGIGAILGRFFSPTFFKIAAGLAVLLFIVGVIIWLFERRDNEDDFREGKEGIWDGFWWAGVTMTTIGYGDKAPDSVGGKISALLWMLVSMGVTASLTAALVSALGLSGGSGGGGVKVPGDLRDKTVGVVQASASADYLEEEGVAIEPVADVPSGLRAVADDRLELFVGPAPVMAYYNSEGGFDLDIGTTQAEPQSWAFAVADDGDLREPLSRAVLEQTRGTAWRSLLSRYSASDS